MLSDLDALRRAKVERGWDWTLLLYTSHCSGADLLIGELQLWRAEDRDSVKKRVPFKGLLADVVRLAAEYAAREVGA